jgi:proteasome lid subunit RPN8/RPN11
MMKWTPADPDSGCRSIEDCDYRFTVSEVCRAVLSKDPRPVVVFPKHVRKTIIEHLSSKSTELGGLLFGLAFTAGADPANSPLMVQITNSIESNSYQSTGVSLRMDTEIWDRAKPFIEKGQIVVGWYHSHPNLGAFFSGTDRKNQAAVFFHPYSLGLVIDPIRLEEKWFIGRDSAELPPTLIREAL